MTPESPTCKLCLTAEANQTGSHLLSSFLVESMIGKRDIEKGFLLTKSPDLNHRINKKADPIKEDYILCRGCEQRLAFLESYISSEFTSKINIDRYAANFPLSKEVETTPYLRCLNVDVYAFSLLLYSIIWRASLSNTEIFKGFKLPGTIEKNLRCKLNELLPPYENFKVKAKPKNWIKEINSKKDGYTWYKYIIIKSEEHNQQDTSRNMVFIDSTATSPFTFLFNEYLVYLFADDTVEMNDDFFSITENIGDIKHLVNIDGPLKVGIIADSEWLKIIKLLASRLADQKVREIQAYLLTQFSLEYGRNPSKEEYMDYLEKFLSEQPFANWESDEG